MKVYDATNQILGRLATKIAKELLQGEKVVVVNCEKAVLSGNPKWKIQHYMKRIQRGDPIHGPFFPKTPDGIFHRAVRGMLPWDKPKGRTAYKNLQVFIGDPENFSEKAEKLDEADAKKLKTNFITIGELSAALGAKKRW
jgi:large subunit ribosomal protein L13